MSCGFAGCLSFMECRVAPCLPSIPPGCPKGRPYMARTTLAHFTASREELLARTSDLFRMIADGTLKSAHSKEVFAGGSPASAPGHGIAAAHGQVPANPVRVALAPSVVHQKPPTLGVGHLDPAVPSRQQFPMPDSAGRRNRLNDETMLRTAHPARQTRQWHGVSNSFRSAE